MKHILLIFTFFVCLSTNVFASGLNGTWKGIGHIRSSFPPPGIDHEAQGEVNIQVTNNSLAVEDCWPNKNYRLCVSTDLKIENERELWYETDNGQKFYVGEFSDNKIVANISDPHGKVEAEIFLNQDGTLYFYRNSIQNNSAFYRREASKLILQEE